MLDHVDPARPAAWRSERVQEIFREGPGHLPSRKFDDPDIWRYFRYMQAWNRAKTKAQQNEVVYGEEGVYLARRILQDHNFGGRENVEARLLAGQSDQEIAKHLGIWPVAIEIYEKLFFNVRDRLNARDWVIRTIMGGDLQLSFADLDYVTPQRMASVYRTFGYFGGPFAVDFISGGLFEQSQFPSPAAVPKWAERSLVSSVTRLSIIGVRTLRLTQDNIFGLLGTLVKIWELDQRERLAENRTEEQHDTVLDLAKSVFSKLHLMMGQDVPFDKLPDPLRRHWESAVEPRMRDAVKSEADQDPDLQRLMAINPLDLNKGMEADVAHEQPAQATA